MDGGCCCIHLHLHFERRPWRWRPVMWRTRAAGRLSPRVMHDLQVTAECFVHALPKVRVAKKTIERTTIPCTRRARHDTHTMATGSLGEGVPVVRRRLSYYIKYSVFTPTALPRRALTTHTRVHDSIDGLRIPAWRTLHPLSLVMACGCRAAAHTLDSAVPALNMY